MKVSPSKPRRARRPEVEAAAVPEGPVVGLGATAGGPDAFKKIFSAMPPDSGMAFVLLPHRAAAHERQRAELLTRAMPMRVVQVEEGMAIEPNQVYMIPPGRSLVINRGMLHLIPEGKWGEHDGLRREATGQCPDGARATFPLDLMIGAERRKLERAVFEAVAREQQRISRDLHDRVGQELTGIGYLAASLSHGLGATPQGEVAAKINQSIERAIGEIRNAIRRLTPVAMEDNGLATALEGLAVRTQEQFAIPCRFVGDRSIRLGDNRVGTHLYLIAQEAVHNAVKHAQASQITVKLNNDSDRLTLQVRDDGVGIPCPLPAEPSMGLNIMRYRAAEIGAALAVERDDGRGTRVTCTLPRSKPDG
jgi:signal transduction histidine kinase